MLSKRSVLEQIKLLKKHKIKRPKCKFCGRMLPNPKSRTFYADMHEHLVFCKGSSDDLKKQMEEATRTEKKRLFWEKNKLDRRIAL